VLYIVLILVLGALGLLVTALITANSLWAWVSIGLSVVAGLFLVVDFVRRRRRRVAAPAEEAEPEQDAEATEDVEASDEAESEQTKLLPESGDLEAKPGKAASEGDPEEEESTPEDVEVVAELEVEVVVVDEYPRYHLTDCGWLGDRETIPLAVKEARDLGFTPCSRCTPDAKLAAEHRSTSKS
jgi:hypothetical protein